MVQVTLQSRELCEVELPCDDRLSSLTLRAIGGKCTLDIQATLDGMTWSSPVAHARLGSDLLRVALRLPAGTRKIRALIHNNASKASYVEIDD